MLGEVNIEGGTVPNIGELATSPKPAPSERHTRKECQDQDVPACKENSLTTSSEQKDNDLGNLKSNLQKALADSDDEEDADSGAIMQTRKTPSADENEDEVQRENLPQEEEDDDDEDADDGLITVKKKAKRRAILADSDDESSTSEVSGAVTAESVNDGGDESEADQRKQDSTGTPHRKARAILDSDDSDDEENTETSNVGNSHSKSPVLNETTPLNGDLFDAEMDSEEEGETKKDERNETSSDSSDEDTPRKVTRALKGAAKGKSRSGRQKIKKDEVQQIHSETQRLVRESRVKLPYHQPTPPPLQHFLQRTAQKQAQLANIGSRAAAIKAKPILTSNKESTRKKPSKDKDSVSKTSPAKAEIENISVSKITPTKPQLLNNTDCVESNTDQQSDMDTAVTTSDPCPVNNDQSSQNMECDDDLPDIVSSAGQSYQTKSTHSGGEGQRSDLPDLTGVDIDKESRQGEGSDRCDDKKGSSGGQGVAVNSAEDSGVVVTPFSSSEEENSSKDSSSANDETTTNSNNDDNKNPDMTTTPVSGYCKTKSVLTPKLKALGLTDLYSKLQGFTPKLQADRNDAVIDLDEDFVSPKPTGLDSFIERTITHTSKKSAPKEKTPIQLSFIHKVTTPETGKEELKRDTITYVEEEENPLKSLEKPGAKWMSVKEQLKVQMRQKREEARSKRCELHELDNEEGFGEEEEEEAELTDQTDTDEEGQEEELEEEEEELDELEYGAEEKQKSNPYVNDEADDDDDDDMADDEDDQGADTDHIEEDDDDAANDDAGMNLKLDVSDDEESVPVQPVQTKPNFLRTALIKNQTMDLFDDYENESEAVVNKRTMSSLDIHEMASNSAKLSPAFDETTGISDRPFEQLSQEKKSITTVTDTGSVVDLKSENSNASSTRTKPELERDTSFNSMDTSFEMIGSLIPAHQPGGGMKYGGRGLSIENSAQKLSKSSRSLSELTLPIEDTQDLCDSPLMSQSTPKVDSQSYHFSLDDDTQSQLLDADGFLKLHSSEKRLPARSFKLDSPAASQDMDELLALCSGQFSSGTPRKTGTQAVIKKSLFSNGYGHTGDTQTNMDELLPLCSGTFTESNSQSSCEPSQQKSRRKRIREDEEDENSNASFGFQVAEDEDDSANLPTQQVSLDSDDEVDSKKSRRKLVKPRVEESDNEGSNSDDDDEEKEKKFGGFLMKRGKLRKDFVEDEAELSGSEAESDENDDLDDDEDILEMEAGDQDVLPEDELRDQVGRVHLKKVIDQDKRELMYVQEMFLPDGDLHSEGGGRMRRFRWANADKGFDEDRENQSDEEKDEQNEEENEAETKWRMERFEREKFLQSQSEDLDDSDSQFLKLGKVVFKQKNSDSNQPAPVNKSKPVEKVVPPKSPKSIFKLPKGHGSFLKRGKEQLAKIAESSKSVVNPLATRNSRNFLFSTGSQEETKKPQVLRRSVSVASSQPAAKRPKLERGNSLPKNSIFNLF